MSNWLHRGLFAVLFDRLVLDVPNGNGLGRVRGCWNWNLSCPVVGVFSNGNDKLLSGIISVASRLVELEDKLMGLLVICELLDSLESFFDSDSWSGMCLLCLIFET